MIVAVDRLRRRTGPRPTVILVGAADEEYVMRGARALLDQLPPVDGVVIGEPTSLEPVRAHNGFIRVRLSADGVSAHSSKAFLGINAIVAAARCVVALQDRLGAHLHDRQHPLTGPALLTSTMISGGSAPNIVPDQCSVWLDRRLAPGEQPDDALAEIEQVLDEVRAKGQLVSLDEPLISLPGLETAPDHPLVIAAERVAGPAIGVTYSTDACYLNGYGNLPCIVLGPGSIDQAHTANEWIELDQVHRSVDVYEQLLLTAAAVEPGGMRP
jgi:acetylornithine deacetylase/succinyl-diaminopimelate desuccinylase-like protein